MNKYSFYLESFMRKREGDKHNDLIQAGLRMIARKGYDQTKITEIAVDAKVATGTFYLYFPGKDELLVAIFDMIWNDLYQRLSEIEIQEPEARLKAALRMMITYLLDAPNRAQLYLGEYARILRMDPAGLESAQKCLDTCLGAVKQGADAGVFHQIHYVLGKATVFGAVRGILELFLRQGHYTLDEVDEGIELILRILRK